MKLTKSQRATLKQKFGGKCAYCGCDLGDRWHADHVLPVRRVTRIDHTTGRFVATGELDHPNRDDLENIMPSCAPCNIDKGVLSLDDWRTKLQGSCESLQRYTSTYRHALRFGLVTETRKVIVFHFEQATP